jgi:hypothetical protein
MMMKLYRWLLIGVIALTLIVAGVSTRVPTSHAADGNYFVYHNNIHGLACSDTGFSFISDDLYNVPQSGYTIDFTVTTSEGHSYNSGQYVPGAPIPGTSGTITDDNWGTSWAAVAPGTAYQIVQTLNFWVDSVLTSQSVATFNCSAGVQAPRVLTLISLSNTQATGAPGCDVLVPLPSTAVVGAFVADAPLYWTPGQLTSPLVTLPAGKTAWVIGKDATGGYYKVLWVCQFVWVPVNTLGPNYDAVWQGRPLPADVVK